MPHGTQSSVPRVPAPLGARAHCDQSIAPIKSSVPRETQDVAGERTPLWYRWSWWHLHQPRGVRWAINTVFVIASLAMFLGLGVVVATDPRFVGDEQGRIRAGLVVGGLFWCCAMGVGLLALRRDRKGAGLP